MSCREIAALRLGLMNVIGNADPSDREHELAELGAAIDQPGPLQVTAKATSLHHLIAGYGSALGELENQLDQVELSAAKRAYLQTLVVLNRKVELDLATHVEALGKLSRDLDAIHDFVHHVHPRTQ